MSHLAKPPPLKPLMANGLTIFRLPEPPVPLPKAFHCVTTTMYSNIAVTDSSLLPVSQSFTYCIAQNGGGGKTLVNQPFQSFGKKMLVNLNF